VNAEPAGGSTGEKKRGRNRGKRNRTCYAYKEKHILEGTSLKTPSFAKRDLAGRKKDSRLDWEVVSKQEDRRENFSQRGKLMDKLRRVDASCALVSKGELRRLLGRVINDVEM